MGGLVLEPAIPDIFFTFMAISSIFLHATESLLNLNKGT